MAILATCAPSWDVWSSCRIATIVFSATSNRHKDDQPHNARRRSRQDALYAFATKELRRAITTSELMPLCAAHSVYQESSKRASHGVGLTCLIGCVSTTQRIDKLSVVWHPWNPRPRTSVCMTIAKYRRSLRRNNAVLIWQDCARRARHREYVYDPSPVFMSRLCKASAPLVPPNHPLLHSGCTSVAPLSQRSLGFDRSEAAEA